MLAPHAPQIPRFSPAQCALLATAVIVAAFAPPRCAPALAPRDASHDARPPGSALLYADAIEVNAATAEDFESLPGIGPARARQLVRLRAAHEGFCTLEEVRRASRSGGPVWLRISPRLGVTPADRCGD